MVELPQRKEGKRGEIWNGKRIKITTILPLSFLKQIVRLCIHTCHFSKIKTFSFIRFIYKKNTTCTRFDYYATQLKSSRIRMKSTKW